MFHELQRSSRFEFKRIKLKRGKRESNQRGLSMKSHLHSGRVCQRARYPQRVRFIRFIRHYHQYTFPVGACDLLINPQEEENKLDNEKEAKKEK